MQATDTQTRVLTAKTLMNEPVRNTQDEDIGKVEDYMLDLKSGCIQYAVLSFGGFLGIGEKLFAVPWENFTLDTERKCFVLDVDKDALKDTPGFDRDNWPMTEQNDYRSRVDSYWGSHRSSSERSTGTGGMKGDTGVGGTSTY